MRWRTWKVSGFPRLIRPGNRLTMQSCTKHETRMALAAGYVLILTFALPSIVTVAVLRH